MTWPPKLAPYVRLGCSRQRNAGGIVEEIIGGPTGLAEAAEQAAVVVVGAGLRKVLNMPPDELGRQ